MHSRRQAGAREAETTGVSHDMIRRAGGWEDGSLDKNYLGCLPRQAIRVIAGFPKEQGCYWLARALVTLPLSLQKKIFPQVEYWQQKMMQDDKVHTICGSGFLSLLVQLRSIILQDAVILRQDFPEHELFTHAPFNSEEFNTFADTLLNKIRTTTPPQ